MITGILEDLGRSKSAGDETVTAEQGTRGEGSYGEVPGMIAGEG